MNDQAQHLTSAPAAAEDCKGSTALSNDGVQLRRGMTIEDLPIVLSVTETAAFLGVNPKTVLEAMHRGGLPGRRVGKRRIVILRDALLEWLQQGCVSLREKKR